MSWLRLGALAGAAALTKDIYLGLIICCARSAADRMGARQRRPAASRRALVPGAAILVVAPWTWRNYRVRHQFIPVSAGLAGQNLFNGTWERHYATALDPGYDQQMYGGFDDRGEPEAAGDVQDEARATALTRALPGAACVLIRLELWGIGWYVRGRCGWETAAVRVALCARADAGMVCGEDLACRGQRYYRRACWRRAYGWRCDNARCCSGWPCPSSTLAVAYHTVPQ